jgi:hypothetical protein
MHYSATKTFLQQGITLYMVVGTSQLVWALNANGSAYILAINCMSALVGRGQKKPPFSPTQFLPEYICLQNKKENHLM